jgi:hypothetical protein
VYTFDIKTIWPLFGMSVWPLATCVLIVGTTTIIRKCYRLVQVEERVEGMYGNLVLERVRE